MIIPSPAQVQEGRHLLRGLLRECTYLPDSAAQTCIKSQVLARFRRGKEKGLRPQQWLPKARTGLRVLQGANDGEIVRLRKILVRTYGRAGPRRHELLRPLLERDTESSGVQSLGPQITALQDAAPTKLDISTVQIPAIFQRPTLGLGQEMIEYNISAEFPKLNAIVKSQAEQNKRVIQQLRLKSAVYQMPAKNIWGRSMPRCRVRNLVKKWHNKLLEKIYPPLPEHEWNRLQGLAHGIIEWDGCKPRRKRPVSMPDGLVATDLEKLSHLVDVTGERGIGAQLYLQEAQSLDRPSELSTKDRIMNLAKDDSIRKYWKSTDTWLADPRAIAEAKETLLQDEMRTIRPLNKRSPKDRGHKMTRKFMRKLWLEVFKLCPLLTKGNRGWQVIWGSERDSTISAIESSKPFAAMFPVVQKDQTSKTGKQRKMEVFESKSLGSNMELPRQLLPKPPDGKKRVLPLCRNPDAYSIPIHTQNKKDTI